MRHAPDERASSALQAIAYHNKKMSDQQQCARNNLKKNKVHDISKVDNTNV
jgi:hypothetical protein